MHSHSSLAAHPFVHAALAAGVLIGAVELQAIFAPAAPSDARVSSNAPIRVFMLAGDENVLEQAPVGSRAGEEKPGTLEAVAARTPRFGFLSYRGNAESYLEIGEAMARAVLALSAGE
jgi:hypothetical protein